MTWRGEETDPASGPGSETPGETVQRHPRNEFEQNSASSFFTKAAKDLYRLTVEGGMDAYRYEHAEEKDETTWIGRINGNRYFDGNRVNLTSSYSIARTEKERAFKNELNRPGRGKGPTNSTIR